MPFCNACGGTMETGAKFCPKCGAATVASPVASAAAPAGSPAAGAPPIKAQSSSALKIILIILAIIIGLGILSAGTMAFFIHRAISRTHIRERDGNVKMETPFGDLETTSDPAEAARNLGVDVYPGASVVQGGAANMTIGGMHTAAADFETSDPADRVASFYKARFSNASVMSAEEGRYSIVAGDKGNMTTITIEPREGKTRIHIAKVTGKMVGGSSN
jgi:hypothetical protein